MFYEHTAHGPVIPPQIHKYNSLEIHDLSLIERRQNLRSITQRIESAMGLRDHRKEKISRLAVTSGKHFGEGSAGCARGVAVCHAVEPSGALYS